MQRPLIVFLLVALAVGVGVLVGYYVLVLRKVVSPVEFVDGADGISTIDSGKTKASIEAKLYPSAYWVSEDALRIRSTNNTKAEIKLSCSSVNDPNQTVKSIKIYLTNNTNEIQAIELGENGEIIQKESSWITIDINEMYKIKVVSIGKNNIKEGQQATITVNLEVK